MYPCNKQGASERLGKPGVVAPLAGLQLARDLERNVGVTRPYRGAAPASFIITDLSFLTHIDPEEVQRAIQ